MLRLTLCECYAESEIVRRDVIVGGRNIGVRGGKHSGDMLGGGACVVFGRESAFPALMDLSEDTLDGTNGFFIKGARDSDFTGWAVGAGDINGDGIG